VVLAGSWNKVNARQTMQKIPAMPQKILAPRLKTFGG